MNKYKDLFYFIVLLLFEFFAFGFSRPGLIIIAMTSFLAGYYFGVNNE